MSDEITIDTELETLFATFGREEVIEYIKSLEVEAPKAKAAGKTKSAADDGHPCEYATKSKEGVIAICPKKTAKNEHDGMWFCGTEKSGHYKSTLTASKKVAPAKAPAKATVASKNQDARTKASALVQKVTKVEKLSATEVVPGSGIYADLKHFRIVFDRPLQKAYGVLDEDKETVLPLTAEAITFLEAIGVDFDAEPPVPAKKAAAKASSATKVAAAKAPAAKTAPVAAKAPAGKTAPAKPATKAPPKPAPVAAKAPAAKPVTKAPPKPAPVAAKAPAAKAPSAKAPIAKPATKAVPAKAAPTKAPAAKPVAKAPVAKNAKAVKVTEEDQETLDALKQSVEDALTEVEEAEPDAEEEVEEVEEVEEEAEIDLGEDEEQEPEVEEEEPADDEEDDSPDIEEVEEGEAAEDEEEEEVAEDD